MDRTDVFICRNFRMGSCPRSVPKILQEDSMYLQMGCETCHGGWVVTMPDGKAKARYESKLDEIKRQEKLRREREATPVYFT